MVCVAFGGGVETAGYAQGLPGATAIPKAGPVAEGKGGVATESASAGISSTSPLLPFDIVQVSVFQEPELETRARVTADGTVVLPLIGAVKIGGKTLKQATAEVTALYKKDYLVNPEVSIALLEQANREARTARLVILGQVVRPGTVEIPADKGMPIIEAIALAGGFTRLARESRITVKRMVAGKEEVFKVDGKDQASGGAKIFLVYPGDVVNVSESLF